MKFLYGLYSTLHIRILRSEDLIFNSGRVEMTHMTRFHELKDYFTLLAIQEADLPLPYWAAA